MTLSILHASYVYVPSGMSVSSHNVYVLGSFTLRIIYRQCTPRLSLCTVRGPVLHVMYLHSTDLCGLTGRILSVTHMPMYTVTMSVLFAKYVHAFAMYGGVFLVRTICIFAVHSVYMCLHCLSECLRFFHYIHNISA